MKRISFEELPDQVAKLTAEIQALRAGLLEENPSKEKQEIMGVEECAALLMKSPKTLYTYTSNNLIPFHKKGKKLIFFRSEILTWIKSGKQKTIMELQEDTDDLLSNIKPKRHGK